MRTTVNIDDRLLSEEKKQALLHLGALNVFTVILP